MPCWRPGSDDANPRLEVIGGELEANLIVALAGGAVGDGVGPFAPVDLHHALADARAGQRGAEQVV
jgi:hypothetical protein